MIMKRIIIAAIVLVQFSCHSKDQNVTNDSKNNNEVGVQNGNGGIADTTNAINLSTHKKDSIPSHADSLKK